MEAAKVSIDIRIGKSSSITEKDKADIEFGLETELILSLLPLSVMRMP